MKIQHQTIREIGEIKLVGFRVLCPGEQYVNEIPKAANRLSNRIHEIKHVMNPSEQIGAFVVETTAEDKDGYWVCVEVKDYENIPKDMVTVTIPPQRYAVHRHIGLNTKIMDVYEGLHKWIKENGYTRLKDKWHLERFYNYRDPENVDVELLDTIE